MPRTTLTLADLPYPRDALEPVISKVAVDVHYGTLTKNYVKKYNETGDPFQKAGAELHEIWWKNLRPPTTPNDPDGKFREKICIELYKGIDKFKEAVAEQATTIHGNGWCAVLQDGEIVQIPNHKLLGTKIVLLIDLWEHSYFLDYKSDKKKYVENIWKIVNWDVVNQRM